MDGIILGATTLTEWGQRLMNIGMVAIGLGFVIFVHELGHFLVAKACGVKCEKFYVGFDFFNIPLGLFTIPRSLVKFQWGETEYGIGSIPLGGYVKMLGQDDNPNAAEEEAKRIRSGPGGQLDPRSYPAQTVPERMAIISAGVIMNVIFGCIFAAIAYFNGVREIPTVIGSTSAGDPAWQIGLMPGDRILQLGKDGRPNEKLRFGKDMMVKLALSDIGTETDLLVRRATGDSEWFRIKTSDRLKDASPPRPTIGIRQSLSLELAQLDEEDEPFYPAEFKKIRKGDVIAKVNGEVVQSVPELLKLLAVRPNEPLELTISRPATDEELKKDPNAKGSEYLLAVPAVPVRDYGIQFVADPIHAIQDHSPASGKFKAGDRLVSYQGEPIGDPLTFPQRTLHDIGKTVSVGVERKVDGETKKVELEIELRSPVQGVFTSVAGNAVGVETMGIAYNLTSKIATVQPGGPADGKIKPGDVVTRARFEAANQDAAAQEKERNPDANRSIKLDGREIGWTSVLMAATAGRFPTTKLVLDVQRGETSEEVRLESVPATDFFLDEHALPFRPLLETHQAASWPEALSLGCREMKERMLEVVQVLTRLVSGRMSPLGLGGPLQIFQVAGVQASHGLPELLMFFAMLSANLAIMNFLPIPALDGGHMIFLLYEAIFRKPVDEELQIKLSLAGILMLLTLMVFVTALDLGRIFL